MPSCRAVGRVGPANTGQTDRQTDGHQTDAPTLTAGRGRRETAFISQIQHRRLVSSQLVWSDLISSRSDCSDWSHAATQFR